MTEPVDMKKLGGLSYNANLVSSAKNLKMENLKLYSNQVKKSLIHIKKILFEPMVHTVKQKQVKILMVTGIEMQLLGKVLMVDLFMMIRILI